MVLAEAAVLHAAVGHAVFPVGADKAPLTPRGHHDATTDRALILAWAESGLWDGGIGMTIPDRTFVVDVDPRNGGAETLSALVNTYGSLPGTRRVRTRSGGDHWYYRLPDDRDIRGKLGPGVDIKKPGRGYVLVPPTPGYTYARGGAPAPAPEWLLEELSVGSRSTGEYAAPKFFPFVKGTPYGMAALKQKCEQMRECGEGGRRSTLNTCAFVLATLVAGGELNGDRAAEELLEAAMDAGLTEEQALNAMKSGWDAGLQNPRQAE